MREVPAALLALPERLQCCETLDAVEEIRTQAAVRHAAVVAAVAVPLIETCRHREGEEGKRKEDERDVDVEGHHVGEDGDRGDRRHDDLGQVLPEEGLEAFDSLHQRQYHVAGPVPVEVPRPQSQGVVVDLVTQFDLDDVRRVVAYRVLPVLEQAAYSDQRGDGQQRQCERRETGLPGQDAVYHDTRDGQPGDPGTNRDEAQDGGEHNAEPDAARQSE